MSTNNADHDNYILSNVATSSIRGWIDVRDKLPEPKWPNTEILMCNRAGFVHVGYHEDGDDWRHLNHVEAMNVIAWMPKPDPVTIDELDAYKYSSNSGIAEQKLLSDIPPSEASMIFGDLFEGDRFEFGGNLYTRIDGSCGLRHSVESINLGPCGHGYRDSFCTFSHGEKVKFFPPNDKCPLTTPSDIEHIATHKSVEPNFINILRKMRDVQGMDGNWNYDNYMHGMYNGMEYALSMMEGQNPEYKDAPDKWLSKFENDNLNSMYQKVVSASLLCDPIPAHKREDDALEPPWEVIIRVRRERDIARIVAINAIRELNRILDTGDIFTSRIILRNLEKFLYNDGRYDQSFQNRAIMFHTPTGENLLYQEYLSLIEQSPSEERTD